MGTEDQILKGTKLITNNKKQRLKIQNSGQALKNTVLKKNKIAKVIKNIYVYEMCFKNRVFLCKMIVGFKNEN